MPWSLAPPGDLGRGLEDNLGEKGLGQWHGSGWQPKRRKSSPRAAQHPAGTLAELEEDGWKLLGKRLWSTWAMSETEKHINPPSDNTASHFSPGGKKRGEACLSSLASEQETASRYCKTGAARSERRAAALHGVLGIIHTSPCKGRGARASPARSDYLICAGDEEEVTAVGNRCSPG